MSEETKLTATPAVASTDWLGRWLNDEISTGKACELLGVPRIAGEELLTVIRRMQEALIMAKYSIDECELHQWKNGMKPRWFFGEISEAVDNAIAVSPNHHARQ